MAADGVAIMGKVIVKRERSARVELSNGDQVMISVAKGEVKVTKMKWAGLLPGPALWKSASATEITEEFFDETPMPLGPIDILIERIIDCRSAAEVEERLSAEPSHILRQYAAILERTCNRVIKDVSELPFPKDLIKSVLRHYLKKVHKTDKKATDALGAAYVSLSKFQPLTEVERDLVFLMQSLDHASDDDKSERVDEGGDLYCAVLSRWRADRDALLDELRSLHKSGR
jgi:hypothetical protein